MPALFDPKHEVEIRGATVASPLDVTGHPLPIPMTPPHP